MVLTPNCKINIGLHVVGKRDDGYHDLETIFYPVYGLHDQLTVDQADTFCFEQDGIPVDCAVEDNLIVRCYQAMAARYSAIGPVSISLHKCIPFGAGLGGGSSDAAHMAIALNQIFHLGLTREQLVKEVRQLGADCPFFIYNTPCFAQGIGDVLTPIDFSLKGQRIVMVKPNIAVSTREAYAGIALNPCRLTQEQWKKGPLQNNDFEYTVFAQHPQLNVIKQQLLDAGAYYAAMSGSGSTVFGLFKDDTDGRAGTQFRGLDKDLASMIIFDDTLG